MLMCPCGSITLFINIITQVPVLAAKTEDDDILNIRDICIELST